MEYRLRPALESDLDFLCQLRLETMMEYLLRTWPRQDAESDLRQYDPAHYQIILVNNEPVGALSVSDSPEAVSLERIEIIPTHQRRGLGSRVIQDVMQHASETGRPVRILALKTNPGARRLGFRLIEETDVNYRLGLGD